MFGSDGTFDSSKFNVDGSYISFFAPDVTTIAADAAVVAAFKKQFPGGTSPFGAPNYVLAQMYATAITKSCKDAKITRAELRKNFAKVSLSSTILGPGTYVMVKVAKSGCPVIGQTQVNSGQTHSTS